MRFLRTVSFICIYALCGGIAHADDLDTAIANVRSACGGISAEFNSMKKMAGINTAVTAVGTAAGVGAVATGFTKLSKDKQIEELEKILADLDNADTPVTDLNQAQIDNVMRKFKGYTQEHKNDTPDQRAELRAQLEQRLDKLNKQSKSLGNWRTGLMAGSTVTNVAGAVIAAKNRVDEDLQTMLDNCRASLTALRPAMMQARMEKHPNVPVAQKILDGCAEYETLDVSKIDKRAKGAMISSVAGAATGLAGTVTSAQANSDKIRDDNSDAGKQKEKKLNMISNVFAIGTTAASGAATAFNAAQLSALKKAIAVSDKCQEALQ